MNRFSLRFRSPLPGTALAVVLFASSIGNAAEESAGTQPEDFILPEGWSVELIADESLVKYPQFACFDDRGRLYVAEGTGKNLPGPEIEPLKLAKISLLEDTDGDGRFDERTVFADDLVFGSGVLWHDDSVYVASHPAIWKLTDTDGDDVADEREKLVGRFGFTGNGCDIHGPFFGPDGWLYWTMGRHGYRIDAPDGRSLEGLAARVWRSRLDGTGIERIAGGGFDNTVELVFSERADLCGTMDQYPGDMLLQYVDGGAYPREDHPSLAEFPRTGPLLPAIAGFSAAYPAALCGMARLRTDHFGPGHRGALLTTQFNVRRLQRHTLKREGARLISEDEDFLVSTDWDFHPTDVVEDADGSLVIVDMGSWFNYACPTQKIAKETVTGVLFRVRREDAPKHDDPWGKKIDWAARPAKELVSLLGDARFKVSERAAEELVERGGPAVAPLAKLVNGEGGDEARSLTRRNAVYALSRIGTPEARSAVRSALEHPDSAVREVATHCVSVECDGEAVPPLHRLVIEDTAPVRRKAAAALGRIGRGESVAPLLESVRASDPDDAFLQHSLIYALIRIGAFEKTLPALGDDDPKVRRAALIALDQMNGKKRYTEPPSKRGHSVNPHRGRTFRYLSNEKLTREHVAPLLKEDAAEDPALKVALLRTVSRRPDWPEELVTLATRWVREPELSTSLREALGNALLEAAEHGNVQRFIAKALVNTDLSDEIRRELLTVLLRSRLRPTPEPWMDALERLIRDSGDPAMQREALKVVRVRGFTRFDELLAEFAGDPETAREVRLAATAILAPRTVLEDATFDRLIDQLDATGDPLAPLAAATALGSAKLSGKQRERLVEVIAEAGPLTLPLLVKAFHGTRDTRVGLDLARALVVSPGARALPEDELEQIYGIHRFQRDGGTDEIIATLKPLIEEHEQTHAQQAEYLAELGRKMSAGAADTERGEEVFFSEKAMCGVCHVVDGRGGRLGPDLSRIGAIRKTRALLESIVFPSSAIVPDFRAYTIHRKDGEPIYGSIAGETDDAVFLRTPSLEETRIPRSEIERIEPSEVSFMPQGLEKTMSPEDLNHLLEFLYSLK
ncbi:MAG: PVC-type heme-binding CxxCH protein [Verrucomicrobiales bacterium]